MPPLLGAVHPTIPDVITFAISAAIIVVGAVGVVTSRNPVHAALSLVMTLFGVAVLFVEQRADFLAAVQVIVYAGAIVVLFLFVIMFLGVDRRENIEAEPLRGQRPLALVLVAITLLGGLLLAFASHLTIGAHGVACGAGVCRGSNVAQLGRSVFTTYLYAFEATAALLVAAVVGAVVLARRPSGPAAADDADEPDEPVPAAAGGSHDGSADGSPDAGAPVDPVGAGGRGGPEVGP
jgi:NADH-quinone oxidoreductase subunit J